MRTVHRWPAIGALLHLVLLAGLAATIGLGRAGWLVGLGCALVTTVLVARGLAAAGTPAAGPADRVTTVRAALVGAVAALVADSYHRPTPVAVLVILSAVALVLDTVDGRVARGTGTASPFGARFDMEVDAFLILVLSVHCARSVGVWVLAIGAARYLFVAAGWLLPWLRASAPPRYWGKVVAAVQGIVLTVVAAEVLPTPVAAVVLALALALLAESFGREIRWLWQHRAATASATAHAPALPATTGGQAAGDDAAGDRDTGYDGAGDGAGARRRVRPGRVKPRRRQPARVRQGVRAGLAGTATVLAGALVWLALVSPDRWTHATARDLVQLPVEGLAVVLLGVLAPVRIRRALAIAAGVLLGLLTLVKALDTGFFEGLDRPFRPTSDWGYLGPGIGVLRDSIGGTGATLVVIGVAVLAVAVPVLLVFALLRLTRLAARHRRGSLRALTALGAVWILCAVAGVQVAADAPVAADAAGSLAWQRAREARADLRDQQVFANALGADPMAGVPADTLLTGLRGHDVILAFVESYGRVAVQDSVSAAGVDAVLDAGTGQLRAAGFASQSAFLTSPTFGGISWLAHSTLQSGTWVDSQRRYDQLVRSDRFTLSDAFHEAGWRTVADVPSNLKDWPQGRTFYHYDMLYNAHNVGYQGPSFSYANMPDQYVLAAYQRLELSGPHPPVMAEIDLVSSHTPWAPLPSMVDWDRVGDGSVFAGMPAAGRSAQELWRDADQVRVAYGQSVEYSLTALISFIRTRADPNLVLIVLGDHQPAAIVSGQHASHDVPISIIGPDPVVDRVAGWGWQPGLNPAPDAPVWPMSAFRDRFLTAYGAAPPARR